MKKNFRIKLKKKIRGEKRESMKLRDHDNTIKGSKMNLIIIAE